MTLRIKMIPGVDQVQHSESGIITIIRKYAQHFPKYGMQIVGKDEGDFDVLAVHAGMKDTPYPAGVPAVGHMHGLYWTAMYNSPQWEWGANAEVINSIRHAHVITVPSPWVAETIQRDMHRNPIVIPHGVDWQEWQHKEKKDGYVIGYAKNRAGQDVCDPAYVDKLATSFPDVRFMSTFGTQNVPPNVRVTGLMPYAKMKLAVQRADAYVSCTRETFGIGILEAMAAGLPILGWREGGIVDLVEHGKNGYLARPGDYNDLNKGLAYCLEHKDTLGDNGREMAKQWTWDNVCQLLYNVYTLAIKKAKQPPTCAVIIPSYKYADKVGRAIESAINQTYKGLEEIVVVDDCSPDDGATETVVTEFNRRDPRVKYVRMNHNSGVAIARNAGIATTTAKYICCLDADDRILPQFLEACIDPLEKDRSLGIAYTSMEAVLEDGRKYGTTWPPDVPLFDQQLKGKNQIPTCCVFRREMWENLGGYRARYAPEGCGSEDAEMWLRAGADGWGAKKASVGRMFIYSLGGNTTNRRDYREPNWIEMHPWTKDRIHPVASLATAGRLSHAARIYDTPAISVVIPVGPGHEMDIVNAMDSLEGQDFRMWEAILALDHVDEEAIKPILESYPYAKVFRTEETTGAGAARNLGAKHARAGLLLFLDADDYLLPEALSILLNEFSKEESVVYGDCRAIAYIEDVNKLNSGMRKNILDRNEKTKQTTIRFPAADYNCELAQAMPRGKDPDNLYLVAHITCLVPKLWHDKIGGFDENMISWEDVDWHWRLSKAGYCYRRVHKDIFVYQFTSGGRREKGQKNWKELLDYLETKHRSIETMPCKSCGGSRSMPPPTPKMYTDKVTATVSTDEQYVKTEYIHPNKGQHQVVGMSTRTNYGYRSGGDIFLVHRDDIAAQPMYYRQIQTEVVAPKVEPEQLPPPVSVDARPSEESSLESVPHDLLLGASEEAQEEEKPVGELDILNLDIIPGVTSPIAKQMRENGMTSARAIMDSGLDGLQGLKGVGPNRAAVIIEHVAELIKV